MIIAIALGFVAWDWGIGGWAWLGIGCGGLEEGEERVRRMRIED
jgi:hypothetical protein